MFLIDPVKLQSDGSHEVIGALCKLCTFRRISIEPNGTHQSKASFPDKLSTDLMMMTFMNSNAFVSKFLKRSHHPQMLNCRTGLGKSGGF